MIPLYILAIEDDDDREFMASLYSKYERILYSTVIKITNNYWDAQDVVQSVLVKIIQNKIPLLKRLPERKLINYLVTACHNTAINYVKKQSFWIENTEDDLENNSDRSSEHVLSLEEIILSEEEQREFFHVWNSLDERTKYFLNARYILEQSTAEIAADLQISEAQVRTYLSRARKKALITSKSYVYKRLK